MNQFTYIGSELDLFAQAKNWKGYIKLLLRKYIKGNVLEVGAGIGSNTKLLSDSVYNKWLCLEPDSNLCQLLESVITSNGLVNCYVQNRTIDSLNKKQNFDSILYIDVLEHIKNDFEEVSKVSHHLNTNGNLIILSPSHQCLFTPFDTSIGHYRRYSKRTLKAIIPDDIEIIKIAYLDCIGLLASLGNKVLLQQSQPTLRQIQIWDTLMVPISKNLDPFLGFNLGKSILLVGRKKQ